jgi:hypothetical protein
MRLLLSLVPALLLAACDFEIPPSHTYVVSEVSIPTTPAEVESFGADLDRDGEVDNRLGAILAALAGQGVDLQTAVTGAIDRGSIILLINRRTESFSSTSDARAEVRRGDPMTAMPQPCAGPGDMICRKHLDGTGAFQIAADSPTDAALNGEITGGTFQGGPGTVSFEISLGGPIAVPFQLIGARARAIGLTESGIDTVLVSGGLTIARFERDLLPGIRDRIADLVRVSCPGTAPPGCGCTLGPSTSRTLLTVFDNAPPDCRITADEIQNNLLVAALIAPDVTIDGQPCLSAGLRVEAASARF